MCLTIEQLKQACGFLLLNDFNVFIYCCKICPNEFATGSELEEHILFEHPVEQKHNENVFVNDFISESASKDDQNENHHANLGIEFDVKEEPNTVNDVCQSTKFVLPNVFEDGGCTVEPAKMNFVKAKTVELMKTNSNPPPGVKKKPLETSTSAPIVFYCEMCPNITLSTKQILKDHMKRHIENRLLPKCPICHKKPHNLEKHMKMNHSDDKPFKCDVCSASFKTKQHRINHVRAHTKEKPLICEHCGKAFGTQKSISLHVKRVHTTDRPHQCQQCARKFLLSSQLNDHISAVHSHERRFVCEICDSRHSTKNYLRQHKLIHGEKTKKCRQCDKMFKTPRSRRFHETKVHQLFDIQQEYRSIGVRLVESVTKDTHKHTRDQIEIN